MTWVPFNETDSAWDELVTGLGVVSPYQLSSWSRFRETYGWRPMRFIATSRVAAVQFLTKRPMRALRIAWSPGGPAGLTDSAASLLELSTAIREYMGDWPQYIRLSDSRLESDAHASDYHKSGWRTCSTRLSAIQTLLLVIPSDAHELVNGYSSNWSRNLRRGEQRGIVSEVWEDPNPKELADLYRDVVNLKVGVQTDWRTRANDVARFLLCCGSQLLVTRARDQRGNTLAYRGAVRVGERAFDVLAASSVAGRKTYASHVATHRLLTELSATGCKQLDFGGIDPSSNKGVFDFKHGTGSVKHSYVGEFHIGKPKLLEDLVGKLISSRTT